jgi:hypothetical protein
MTPPSRSALTVLARILGTPRHGGKWARAARLTWRCGSRDPAGGYPPQPPTGGQQLPRLPGRARCRTSRCPQRPRVNDHLAGVIAAHPTRFDPGSPAAGPGGEHHDLHPACRLGREADPLWLRRGAPDGPAPGEAHHRAGPRPGYAEMVTRAGHWAADAVSAHAGAAALREICGLHGAASGIPPGMPALQPEPPGWRRTRGHPDPWLTAA